MVRHVRAGHGLIQPMSHCSGPGAKLVRAGYLEEREEGAEGGDAPGVREAQEARLRDESHAAEAQDDSYAHRPAG